MRSLLLPAASLLLLATALVAQAQTNATNITTTPTTAANATAPRTSTVVPGAVNATVNGTLAGASTPAAHAAPSAAAVPRAGQCARSCVRKEFRSLTAAERTAFFNAVKRLQSMPARTGPAGAATPALPGAAINEDVEDDDGSVRLVRRQNNNRPRQTPPQGQPQGQAAVNGPTEYDRFVKMHLDVAPSAHGSDLFLPWHRAYLNEFEHALQSVSDVPVCLPYWNWALDSQAPEYSPILSPEYFGTNGAGSDGCVTDGQFAGWRPYYPEPGCLRRAYENDGHIGAFHSIEAVNRAISTLNDYTSFRKQLEGVLHPNPHMSIGGHMSTMGSPSDVVFWLHHAFIDQIWSRWQKRNGFGYGGNANDPMLYLGFERNYRPADVLDQRQLCYDYADITAGDLGDNAVVPPSPPPPKTPTGRRPKDGDLPELTKIVPLPADQDDAQRYSSRDRSNLAALRYADPPSQEWCRMNNIPYEENQQYEQEYRRVYKELNSVKGYVSPCALMKRPTLHARIIQSRRVSSFYVDVPDVGRVEVGYKEDVAQADAYQAVANVNQRVYACSPDVELDPQEYRATVQKLIGPSAFSGAADPLRITSMDEIKDSANSMIPATSTLATVAALAVAGLAQMW